MLPLHEFSNSTNSITSSYLIIIKDIVALMTLLEAKKLTKRLKYLVN